jgi:molecular chaperone GrpE (heat shock protein)
MGTKGDKGEEETTVAPAMAEIQALQSHIQRVEAMEQNQGLQLQVDLKSEMATSQSKMQTEIKYQLEEFLSKFLRMQSGTPPPQALVTDTTTSNISHLSDR